jgi:predicted RNA-binding Zn-ribbon protein involved in translation (DUF1610 family)
VATVRASCPSCGDIETTTRAVQVLRCASTGSSSYAFVCPACHLRVAKDASEHVVSLLTDAGVEVVSWTLPAELAEAKRGAAVTHDDLLGFHFALQDPGWLERQVAEMSGVERRSSRP